MEVAPGIYQLKIPIPNNPLGFINSYLVISGQESLLIDTGWNTDEAFESLNQQLAEAGVKLGDLKYIAITHIHPDHYGLVGRLERQSKAALVIHEIERNLLPSRYVHYEDLMEEMDRWLAINGVPPEDRSSLNRASIEILGLVDVAMPDLTVHGGEHLLLGDLDLEILWTPGHSAGHICLYERSRKWLFSGDHILPKITPNISMNSQSIGNPLVDYLNSLRQMEQLTTDLVMPGHGAVFTNLAGRIKEIEQHHEKRLGEIMESFQGISKTAYQIAIDISWFLPFNKLAPFSKRMAITETLAHLELLLAQGRLIKTEQDGIIWYAVP